MMRAVDASRIKRKQGEIEDKCWNAIRKAIFIELGFDAVFT